MQNSDLFLDAFRDIEKVLRNLKPSDQYIRFKTLVVSLSVDNAAIRNFQNDLLEFAELRNAIVHDKKFDEAGNGVVIAEPHKWTVDRIQNISRILRDPPNASQFGRRTVFTVKHTETIREVLPTLFRRNYSQAPVIDSNHVCGLLTANTIARWMGNCLTRNDQINFETNVSEVLTFTETSGNYLFFSVNIDAFVILQEFQKARNERQALDAILFTENGKNSNALSGIVTIFDVPKIQSLINGGTKK